MLLTNISNSKILETFVDLATTPDNDFPNYKVSLDEVIILLPPHEPSTSASVVYDHREFNLSKPLPPENVFLIQEGDTAYTLLMLAGFIHPVHIVYTTPSGKFYISKRDINRHMPVRYIFLSNVIALLNKFEKEVETLTEEEFTEFYDIFLEGLVKMKSSFAKISSKAQGQLKSVVDDLLT